jgi:hypothetical protein
VHNHISFGYEHARATRTAWETFNERRGVCRDYADRPNANGVGCRRNGTARAAASPSDGAARRRRSRSTPGWRILVQRQVRANLIVVLRIRGKNLPQARLAKDQHPV